MIRLFLRGFIAVCLFLRPVALFAEPISQMIFEEQNKIKCSAASASEVQTLHCRSSMQPENLRTLDQTSEYLVFRPIAEKQSDQLGCLLSQERLLQDDEKLRTDALNETCSRLQKLKTALADEDAENKKLQTYFGSKNDGPFFYKTDQEWETSNPINPLIAPEKRPAIYAEIETLKKQRAANRDLIQSLRETDPLLSSSGIFAATQERFRNSLVFGSDSPEKACSYLKKHAVDLIKSDISKIQSSKDFIDRELNSKTNAWLDDEGFKTTLWASGGKGDLLRDVSAHPELMKSTYCRLEGRYGQGAKTRDTVYGLGMLALGGIAADLGKLAATAAFAGRTDTALALTRTALGLDITSGAVMNYRSVVNSCKDHLKVTANQNSCQNLDGTAARSLFYDHLSAQKCVYAASLALLSTAGMGLGIKNALRTEAPDVFQETQVAANVQLTNEENINSIARTSYKNQVPDSMSGLSETVGSDLLSGATKSENEKLSDLFKKMYDLKKGPLSPERLEEISRINDETLTTMQKMLARQGIKTEIRPLEEQSGMIYKPLQRVKTDNELKAAQWVKNSRAELKETNEALTLLQKDAPALKKQESEISASLKTLETSPTNENKNKISSLKFQLYVVRGKLKKIDDLKNKLQERKEWLETAQKAQQSAKTKAELNYQEDERVRKLISDFSNHKTAPAIGADFSKDRAVAHLHGLYNESLVLTDIPKEMKFLRNVQDKYGATIALSPNSLTNNNAMGMVSKFNDQKILFVDLGTALEENPLRIGKNTTNLHEIRHLMFDQKLEKGIETPYQVELTALPGKTLFENSYGFYDKNLSFQELSTWNRDIQMTKKAPSKSYAPDSGSVTKRDVAAVETWKGARAITKRAVNAIDGIQDFLKKNGEKNISFQIKGKNGYEGPSYATVPVFRGNEEVGKARVYLVKLNSENQTDRMDLLKDYVEKVQQRAYEHRQDIEDYLK